MTYSQVERILSAYRQRYDALKQDHRLQFITIFKNHGRESGTSLAHPHSQLVATPIVTPYYHRRFDVAHDYFADYGHCLYCDLLNEELDSGRRIVTGSEHFVVLEPFASRAAYETWIIPRRHSASFGTLAEEHLAEMAGVLKDTLYCLHHRLGNPAFNMMIDTSTTYDDEDPYYHWHLRILPRLSMIAGFEIGSGIYINSMMPEDSAEVLRRCCYSLVKDSETCTIPAMDGP
jgi:UDPglucose--hexose-1-phosphate uridylyltransferase